MRQRTTSRTLVTLGVALLIVVAMGWLLLRPSALAPPVISSDDQAVTYVPATARALANGCEPVAQVVEPTSVPGPVDVHEQLRYDSLIPNSGWFAPTDAPVPSDTATLEQSVRHLHAGGMVLWYSAGASTQDIAELRKVAAGFDTVDVRVWQWPLDRSWQLRDGDVAVAVWGASQQCSTLTPAVVYDVMRLGVKPTADDDAAA